MQRQGAAKFVIWAELMTHALCAIGVYLGRFKRFNTWDFITQPDDLARSVMDDLTAKRPVLVMAVTFVVLTVLYWLMKQVTLGLVLLIRYRRGSITSGDTNQDTDTSRVL